MHSCLIELIPLCNPCFMLSPLTRKACIENSYVKGLRTILNVPSINHVRARASCSSCVVVAHTRWRAFPTCTSDFRKSFGKYVSSTVKSSPVGSLGRSCSFFLLVFRFRQSGFGRLPSGAAERSGAHFAITSLTIVLAGLNRSFRARSITWNKMYSRVCI